MREDFLPNFADRRVVVFSTRNLSWKDTGCVLTEGNCAHCALTYHKKFLGSLLNNSVYYAGDRS